MKKLFILPFLFLVQNAFCLDVTGVKVIRTNGQVFITWNGDTSKEYLVYRTTYKITSTTGWPAVNFGKAPANSTKNIRLNDILTDTEHFFNVPADNVGGTVLLDAAAGYGGLYVLACMDNSTTKYYYGVKMVGSTDAPTPGSNTSKTGIRDFMGTPKAIYQQSLNVDGITGEDMDIYVHFTTAIVPPNTPKMMNSGFLDYLGFNFGVIPYSDLSSTAPHPVIVKLHGGGSNFIEDATGLPEQVPTAYKICPDDRLPNDQTTWWYGYNENYDITTEFVDNTTIPPCCGSGCNLSDTSCHGTNYDYTLQRLLYTIDQVKILYNKAPNVNPNDDIDPNRISVTGKSEGGGGAIVCAMFAPNVFSAVRAQVPKMDFSYTNDTSFIQCPFNFDINLEANENPCYDPNLYYHSREKTNVKWGTITADWKSSTQKLNSPGSTYDVYDLLNAGYMISENTHAGNNLPPIFDLSGKNDGGMGWDEKIPVFDSINKYKQQGVFFWDQGAHHNPTYWDWEESFPLDDLIRYSTKQAFLAFSNGSINDSPAADSGNINGYFDWDETSIVDSRTTFSVNLKWRTLYNLFGGIVLPSTSDMTTNITLRRQTFPKSYTGPICWTLTDLTTSTSVSGEGNVTTPHGSVDINNLSLHYPDLYQLTIVNVSCKVGANETADANSLSIDKIYPNPFTSNFSIELLPGTKGPVTINVINVYGKVIDHLTFPSLDEAANTLHINGENWSEGVYFLEVISGNQKTDLKVAKID